ncbi:Flp family type IVb pilin [Sphingomonas parva]|uniref:Flp family type IVb pilin n=1 Tax=Sphingomonas parva TaxID=2555898 RepID=A0A4Y8ZP00_9SPHN|nr:Flp family type IVb pilin [Sphingomonas parva]TFI56539.1 Flp family type IVb pilin [Sphingomonas parva]
MKRFAKLIRDERAATAIEYALIGALIVVACVGAFGLFGDEASNMWNGVSSNVTGAM